MTAGAGLGRRAVGITGSRGFLGGDVARWLAARGHAVVDLDAYCREPSAERLQALPSHLDWVLHFAARTSIAQGQADPDGILRHNLAATRAALEAAGRAGAAFLYLSSYVYGQPRYNPVDEAHPVAAVNPYMASKLAGETLASEACAQRALPLVILRPFSVYGRAHQPGRLVSDLLDALRRGLPLTVNDPTPRRDHLFADDFCALVQRIVEQAGVPAGVFNVGSGVDHSNLEVAEILRELTGDARPIEVLGRPRPNDVPLFVADLRKVTAAFGWQPQASLRAGLAQLLAGER